MCYSYIETQNTVFLNALVLFLTEVVYSWYNFGDFVIILFFNSLKVIAMNCITWEFSCYTQTKKRRELHYPVMSSDRLAERGTIQRGGMSVACVTETCHQHTGSRDSPFFFYLMSSKMCIYKKLSKLYPSTVLCLI